MIAAPRRRMVAMAVDAGALRRQRPDAVRAQRATLREPPIDRAAQGRHAQVRRERVRRDQATHARPDREPVRPVLATRAPMARVLAVLHRVHGVTHELTLA